MDLTARIVDFVMGLGLADLPPAVKETTKNLVLDTLGSALAGTSAQGVSNLYGLVKEWGGSPQSRAWVFGDKVPAPHAVWLNATAARARDIDEVHEKAVMHNLVSVLPVCLAAAELRGGVSGRELITAVVAGVDIMARLGLSLHNNPNLSGVSSTWQLGVFGACAAAGRILGLDRETMVRALGIAYCQTSGNQQTIIEGTLMVRVMQGITAQAGLMAAILAQKGIDGPRQVFEGKFGYFPVYHRNEYDPAVITKDLGDVFEISNCSIKPYPCCKVIHSAVAGALEIKSLNHLAPENMARVKVKVNKAAYNHVCHPLESKRRPASIPDAQFSLPYCVAVALAKGDLFLSDFTPEALRDERVLGLSDKVEVTVDEEIERLSGREIGFSVVEVVTNEQKTLTAKVEKVKGHPQNPMTMDEVREKFQKCAAEAVKALSGENMAKLTDLVAHLEECPDVAQLAKLMQ